MTLNNWPNDPDYSSNFWQEVPDYSHCESFDALNAHLERRCLERMDATLRGHAESTLQRMERDLDALLPLPPVPYDACDRQAGRVSSLSLVRYKTNDYSVPVAYGHRDVLVRGYVDEVVISCGSEIIAGDPAYKETQCQGACQSRDPGRITNLLRLNRHPRSYERDDFVYNPMPVAYGHPLPAAAGAEGGRAGSSGATAGR